MFDVIRFSCLPDKYDAEEKVKQGEAEDFIPSTAVSSHAFDAFDSTWLRDTECSHKQLWITCLLFFV